MSVIEDVIYLIALLILIFIDVHLTKITFKGRKVQSILKRLREELSLLDNVVDILLNSGMNFGEVLRIVTNIASREARNFILKCILSSILFNNDRKLSILCGRYVPIIYEARSKIYSQLYADLPVDLAIEKLSFILAEEQRKLNLFEEYLAIIAFVTLFLPTVLLEIGMILNKLALLLIIPLLNIFLAPILAHVFGA